MQHLLQHTNKHTNAHTDTHKNTYTNTPTNAHTVTHTNTHMNTNAHTNTHNILITLLADPGAYRLWLPSSLAIDFDPFQRRNKRGILGNLLNWPSLAQCLDPPLHSVQRHKFHLHRNIYYSF